MDILIWILVAAAWGAVLFCIYLLLFRKPRSEPNEVNFSSSSSVRRILKYKGKGGVPYRDVIVGGRAKDDKLKIHLGDGTELQNVLFDPSNLSKSEIHVPINTDLIFASEIELECRRDKKGTVYPWDLSMVNEQADHLSRETFADYSDKFFTDLLRSKEKLEKLKLAKTGDDTVPVPERKTGFGD